VIVPLVIGSGNSPSHSNTPGNNKVTGTATQGATSASASTAASGSTPSTSPHSPKPSATGGPISGDWQVTYGATATVTITLAGGVYTESAKTRVQIIPGVSCYPQPGTAIATFTQTGPGAYTGHAYLWSENTYTIDGTTSMILALSSDGNTLNASLTKGAGIPPTLIFMRI
jgi:hypothetical protein